MNEKEFEKLKKHIQDRFNKAGLDYKTFDLEHETDQIISYEEALNEINEKLESIIPSERDIKEILSNEIKFKIQERDYKERFLGDNHPLQRKYLDHFKTIAIFGEQGTGKTALAYRMIELYKGLPIFFIKHPRPNLIKERGYANLNNLQELERLRNCIIFADEPQLWTSIYDNKTNIIIARACSLARQRNIKLIISSNDTRCFTKHNESYFDLWLIKDCDYVMIKNGSKVKKAIKDNSVLDPEGFRLEINEFLLENRRFVELNGKHKFELCKNWKEEYSRPYE